jgi:hypothetical protein
MRAYLRGLPSLMCEHHNHAKLLTIRVMKSKMAIPCLGRIYQHVHFSCCRHDASTAEAFRKHMTLEANGVRLRRPCTTSHLRRSCCKLSSSNDSTVWRLCLTLRGTETGVGGVSYWYAEYQKIAIGMKRNCHTREWEHLQGFNVTSTG